METFQGNLIPEVLCLNVAHVAPLCLLFLLESGCVHSLKEWREKLLLLGCVLQPGILAGGRGR